MDWRKKQALVVDDFHSFRSNVKEMLRSFGLMQIDDVCNGEDAIERMSQKKYDVILCDYNLGDGKNGQQVLAEARYQGYLDHSTIYILVTAESTVDMVMGALEYQPDDYLIKPFPKMALEKKLREWVLKKEDMKEIDIAAKRGDYAKVLALCDVFIATHPNNLAQYLKLKGEALINQGAYQAAEAFYAKVLTMGNLPWAMLGMGKIKFLAGDDNAAQPIFENIIRQNDKVVTAYDWLAKIHERKGDLPAAQEILQRALTISPKAILRQRALAHLAYKNSDLTAAESAFREVIKQGKYSVFKQASDYISLANLLDGKSASEDSLKVLNDGSRIFTENPEALLQISISQVLALKKLKYEEEAKKTLEKISKLSCKMPAKVLLANELELAKTLILMGDENKAQDILTRLIQSNHEDEELIANIKTIFKELNMEEKGEKMIAALCEEVATVNNDGVRMVREGKLGEAIKLFEKAAEQLPGNKIINANAAQALMLYIKKHGKQPQMVANIKKYLDRVHNIDPLYKDLIILLSQYAELTKGT